MARAAERTLQLRRNLSQCLTVVSSVSTAISATFCQQEMGRGAASGAGSQQAPAPCHPSGVPAACPSWSLCQHRIMSSDLPLLAPNGAGPLAAPCRLVAGLQSGGKAIPRWQKGRRRKLTERILRPRFLSVNLGPKRLGLCRRCGVWLVCLFALCSSYFQLLLCVFALCRLELGWLEKTCPQLTMLQQ